jgi:Fe-S cluster assembly ATPase SufC
MVQGRIVRSGGKELALELEAKGYESYETEAATEKDIVEAAIA